MTDLGDDQKAIKEQYESLSSYVPASVVQYMCDLISESKGQTMAANLQPPLLHTYESVVLFADVSGFTALSEAFAFKGPEGAEDLAHNLNGYMAQIVKEIASQGGDVFKFAGDAMIVLWPPSEEDLSTRVRRAVQAAQEIQKKLDKAEFAKDVVLSVKIGIGVGDCSLILVGGVLDRMEYLATGDPLSQAFAAEHQANPGDIILSPQAWKLVEPFFEVKSKLPEDFVIPGRCMDPKSRVNIFGMVNFEVDSLRVVKELRNYVPGAVLPYMNTPMERWVSELRRVVVVFVNVGFDEEFMAKLSRNKDMKDLKRIQEAVALVQSSVYRYEGSMNKFLFDDKGSTLLAAFGLPPLGHINDSIRGILSAIDILDGLRRLGLTPSVGVTTGIAYTGVTGSHTRREYAILGDIVNLSARLMQFAVKRGGGIICDSETQYLSSEKVKFKHLEPIMVKGKKKKIKVFEALGCRILTLRTRQGAEIEDDSISSGVSKKAASNRLSTFLTKKSKEPKGGLERSAKEARLDLPSSLGGEKLVLKNGSYFATATSPTTDESRKKHRKQKSSSFSFDFRLFRKKSSKLEDGGKTLVKKESMSFAKLLTTSLAHIDAELERLHVSERDAAPIWIHKVNVSVQANSETMSLPFDATGTIKDLKVDIIKFVSEAEIFGADAFLNSDDFVLIPKDSKLHLTEENLRVDVIPVLCAEAPLLPDQTLGLSLVRKDKAASYLEDGRQDIRSSLALSVDALLSGKSGKTVVIESELGFGKTRLISETVCNAPLLVCCATADAVTNKTPLEVYADLLLQIIDYDIHLIEKMIHEEDEFEIDEDNYDDGGIMAKRRAYIEAKVTAEPLCNSIAVLNQMLDIDLEETAETAALEEPERIALCKDLVVYLMAEFTQTQSFIVVVDDAAYMDPASWDLTRRISDEIDFITLVLATPPMNNVYLPIFGPGAPPEYQQILEKPSTEFHHLQSLPSNTIYNLALQNLNVSSIRQQLAELLTVKSRGNPLVCMELMYTLRKAGLIEITSDGNKKVCVLSDAFDESKIPIPSSLMNMLGCRIDRLSHIQQLLLKIASIIGTRFSLNLLCAIYPVDEHKSVFESEIEDLVRLKVLNALETFRSEFEDNEKYGWKKDKVYQFSDGFMREVILSRVLSKLRKPIETSISKIQEEAKRRMNIRKSTRYQTVADCFEVTKTSNPEQKSFQKKYKLRWVKLTESELIMLNSADAVKSWRILKLVQGTTVEIASEDEAGRPFVVKIGSREWSKNSKAAQNEKLVFFYLSFADSFQANQWKTRLQTRINH